MPEQLIPASIKDLLLNKIEEKNKVDIPNSEESQRRQLERLAQDLSGSGEKEVSVDPNEKDALVQLALRLSDKQARDWEGCLRNQRYLNVAYVLAGPRQKAEITQRIIEQLNVVDQLSKEESQSGARERLSKKTYGYYLLFSLQATKEGREFCGKLISELEGNWNKRSGKDVSNIVDQDLKALPRVLDSEMLGKQDLKRSRELVKMLKRFCPRLGDRVQEVNGEYLYKYENGKHSSLWKFGMSSEALMLVNTQNNSMVVGVDFRTFANAAEKNEEGRFFEEAIKNYESEERGKTTLESFDLPANGEIAHIRLFPRSFDPVIAGNLGGAMVLSRTLSQHYGERLKVRPVLFSDDPVDALTKEIEAVRSGGKGPKHFVIDIFSHGGTNNFRFDTKFTAHELVSVLERFPDCTFTIGTIACFGAGMRKGMEKEFDRNSSLQKRVDIFLQTKPNVRNTGPPARNRAEPEESFLGNFYQLHFMRALLEGKTYGQAVREADIETKKKSGLDAEAFINGQFIATGKSSGNVISMS